MNVANNRGCSPRGEQPRLFATWHLSPPDRSGAGLLRQLSGYA